MSKSRKIFFTVLVVIITISCLLIMVQEVRKMDIRWLSMDDECKARVENSYADLSEDKLLAETTDCAEVKYSDLKLHFTTDVSAYVKRHIFIIESYMDYRILYKGQFNMRIEIKRVPYCASYKGIPDGFEENVSDVLQFSLFDIENRKGVLWLSGEAYPYYNGKVNVVTLFSDYSNEYDGYYKVEQVDER